MLVELHGTYSGKTIVEALKRATETPAGDVRWRHEEIIGDYRYDPMPAHLSVHRAGIRLQLYRLKKKYVLFGEKVWKPDGGTTITLKTVVLSDTYSTIEVAVRHVYEYTEDGEYSTTDPSAPEFKPIRPLFERLLNDFASTLATTN